MTPTIAQPVKKPAAIPTAKKRVTFEDLGFVPVLALCGLGKRRMERRSLEWWYKVTGRIRT